MFDDRLEKEIAWEASKLMVRRIIENNNYRDIPTEWNADEYARRLYPEVYSALKKAFKIKTIIIKKDENGEYYRAGVEE